MSGARPLGAPRTGHAGLTGTGRSEVREAGVEVVPVKRYWPGKAPAWASGQADEAARAGGAGAPAVPARAAGEQLRERYAGAVVARAAGRDGSPRAAEADEAEEEDDDDIDVRRERARARARALAAEAEEGGERAGAQLRAGAGPDEAEGSSSEYETDTGDESGGDAQPLGRVLLKPVFVPKTSRVTVNAQRAAEEAEEEAERRRIEKLAERRKETLEMVVDIARREQEGDGADVCAEMPDDADDEDDLAEYEAWKLRELKRVRDERERAAAAERERSEVERRRGLSEDERMREDEARLAARAAEEAPVGQRSFLQKYFHKGAFFQAEDRHGNPMLGDIMKRDFGEVRPRARARACRAPPASPARVPRPRSHSRAAAPGDGRRPHRRQVVAAKADAGEEVWVPLAGQVDAPLGGGHDQPRGHSAGARPASGAGRGQPAGRVRAAVEQAPPDMSAALRRVYIYLVVVRTIRPQYQFECTCCKKIMCIACSTPNLRHAPPGVQGARARGGRRGA